MRNNRSRSGQKGLVLVELMVVMSVLGLILGLLLPSVQGVRNANPGATPTTQAGNVTAGR